MDVFTHFLIPFGVATLLRRPKAERYAAGIGGYAPDLDVLWAWVARLDPALYPFVHRGFSHTFWGAALLAVFLLWVLTRPALVARFTRLRALAFSGGAILAAVLGSQTHPLLLDAVTITGTPAFWPFTTERWTANFFFWSATLALPTSLVALVLLWKGKIEERGVLVGTLAVLLVLAATGGVRAWTYPAASEDAIVIPTASDGRWIVAEPRVGPGGERGFEVTSHAWGERTANATYLGNATGPALAAASACRENGAHIAWRWGGTRAEIVNATPEQGGFRLHFLDAAAWFEWDHGEFSIFGWKPPVGPNRPEAYDTSAHGVRCLVVDGRVVDVARQSSFWG